MKTRASTSRYACSVRDAPKTSCAPWKALRSVSGRRPGAPGTGLHPARPGPPGGSRGAPGTRPGAQPAMRARPPSARQRLPAPGQAGSRRGAPASGLPHRLRREQVQKPVAIVVESAGRDRSGLVVNPRLARHLFESPITAIAIQRIMIHPGDEQIGAAIVIVVRGGRAHAVPLAAQTRFGRDIFEHAAPAIAVEPVPPTGIGLDQARLARAVSEKRSSSPSPS